EKRAELTREVSRGMDMPAGTPAPPAPAPKPSPTLHERLSRVRRPRVQLSLDVETAGTKSIDTPGQVAGEGGATAQPGAGESPAREGAGGAVEIEGTLAALRNADPAVPGRAPPHEAGGWQRATAATSGAARRSPRRTKFGTAVGCLLALVVVLMVLSYY